jgi:hypothetical protein
MLKKLEFQSQRSEKLNNIDSHSLRQDTIKSFYETFDFIELISKWPLIVGEKLSAVTSPLRLRNDSLVVVTKHSIFSQELSYLQEEIKQEIFKNFPNLKKMIKKIIFQTSESFFQQISFSQAQKSQTKSTPHPMSPLYRIKRHQAEEIFKTIQDEELKKILMSLFIQS